MKEKNRHAYSAGEAAKAAGIPYYKLNNWAMKGLITPSIDPGSGYGGVRMYSLSDIISLHVAGRMRDSGLPLKSLHALINAIQVWREESSRTFFIGGENGSVDVCDEVEALTALKSKDRASLRWVIDIRDIAEDMKSRLQKLSRPVRGKSVRVT